MKLDTFKFKVNNDTTTIYTAKVEGDNVIATWTWDIVEIKPEAFYTKEQVEEYLDRNVWTVVREDDYEI